MEGVESEDQDAKGSVSLPLARIKKVMKSDEEVKVGAARACYPYMADFTHSR